MHLKGMVIKIDLSKAYDHVSWIYLRLLLTHVGFCIDFIMWVMSCIQTASFVVLINGASSTFFHAQHDLLQGCPLSPLLFLLVEKFLSRYWRRSNEWLTFRVLWWPHPLWSLIFYLSMTFYFFVIDPLKKWHYWWTYFSFSIKPLIWL